jgi:hypothetical protein
VIFIEKPTYMDAKALSIKFAGRRLRQIVKLCEYAQKLNLNQDFFFCGVPYRSCGPLITGIQPASPSDHPGMGSATAHLNGWNRSADAGHRLGRQLKITLIRRLSPC